MTQGEFLPPFAPACLPRHWTQEPRTSLGDYSPPESWGTWGTKLPPQEGTPALEFALFVAAAVCGIDHMSRSNPSHFALVWMPSFNRFSDRFGGLLGDPIRTLKIRRVNHLVYIWVCFAFPRPKRKRDASPWRCTAAPGQSPKRQRNPKVETALDFARP